MATEGTSALATRRRAWPNSDKSGRPAASSRPYSADEYPDHAAGVADITWRHTRHTVVGGKAKRGFDIVFALTAIVLLLPLLCLIALAIKLCDRGPVLYRHRRVGLNGTAFDCLKFRSMMANSEEVLARHLAANSEAARELKDTHKLKHDPRVTPLGASMRKTSIDELPQLINILKGEMSFVGPRPIVTAEVEKYGDVIGHYLRARPGLTGPWQISGRNDVTYAARVALDRAYVEDWSFRRDVAIIAKTVRVVVLARGCY